VKARERDQSPAATPFQHTLDVSMCSPDI